MMNVLELLDRPIAFQRCFVTITGSINAALMLSQAVYWNKRATLHDNWFWKTQDEWMEETGLTRYEQEGARKSLRNLGIFEEKKEGIPAKLYFRVNTVILNEFLLNLTVEANRIKDAEKQHARSLKSDNLDAVKTADKTVGKPLYNTETTTEITSETTTEIKDIVGKPEKPKPEKFIIPTFEQVSKHIADKNYCVDAESFIAHYNSNGWMVGKNKMKCWKSALVTWDKRNPQQRTRNDNYKNSFNTSGKQSLVDQAIAGERRVEDRMRREAERSIN